MLAKFAVVASAIVGLVSAQTTTAVAASTVSQSMPAVATQGFNIGLTLASDRMSWCQAQRNNCPKICGGIATSNTCDSDTLQWSCICSNGTTPDVSAYQDTIPFFECQATFGQCINANANNADGQATCTTNEQCGTLNATAADSSSSSSSSSSAAASSSSSAPSSSSLATSASATAASTSASASATHNAAAMVNTDIATGVFAGVVFAIAKVLL